MIRLLGRATSGNVQKVVFLLEEMGLPYKREDYGRQFNNTGGDYLKLNPTGKVPTLMDGDTAIWESNTILRYLANKTGRFYASDAAARTQIERWMDWQLAALNPPYLAVFREAKRLGLVCSYVSNGNATPEVLDYIQPYVSLYKVDLKSFRDKHYRELGGTLARVLWTIRELHARGFWVEIVTLVIPGFNDSDEELREIADFLVSVSPDIPWHVTAFHRDYKMTKNRDTGISGLLRAAEIGRTAGLNFVYAGNIPGAVGDWENTYCPGCRALLVERVGFHVLQNRVKAGACSDCTRKIPGFWS